MRRKYLCFFLLSIVIHAVALFFFFRIPLSKKIVSFPEPLIVPVKIASGETGWSYPLYVGTGETAVKGGLTSDSAKTSSGPVGIPQREYKESGIEPFEEPFPDGGAAVASADGAGGTVEDGGGGLLHSIPDTSAFPDTSTLVKQLYDSRVWPKARIVRKKDPAMKVDAIVPPDLKLWARRVVRRVRENWNLPPGFTGRGQTGVTLRFAVDKQGRIENVILVPGMAGKDFQEKALNALNASSPLPPLPSGYTRDRLELELVLATK